MSTDRYFFRGKSCTGSWIFGNSLKYTDNPIGGNKIGEIVYVGNKVPNARKLGSMTWIPIDSTTLGQYTGILDKNGQKIFEGDIVKISILPTSETAEANSRNAELMGINMPSWVDGGDIIARISFFDGAYHFIHLRSYLPQCGENVQEPMLNYLFYERHPDIHQMYNQTIEVIGNIHDNPELLKSNDR